MENTMTGDGRLIEAGALTWDDLPIPLRYVSSDVGAHDGAQVVGMITEIHRDGDRIMGSGPFDLNSPHGAEASRQVAEGLTTGVSMDLDDVSFEIRVAADLLSAPDIEADTDEDGRVTVVEIASDDEVMVTTSGRIRAATIVAIPAFAEAKIAPVSNGGEADHYDTDTSDLVAAAAPFAPPAEWFADPRLGEATPITVTDDGRVYGHLAAWGTCHIGHTHTGCVTPPRSSSDYAYFRTGAVRTADGTDIPTGVLTLNTGHAAAPLSAAATLAHYENTGTAVADVTVGEDNHGIWVAGAMRPSATDEQVRALRGSPLSGDWRKIGGNLELVAALAVNVPGFPIPRPAGLRASGSLQTLVASGMVPPRTVTPPGQPGALSADDLRYLKRLAARERADEAGELARRVKVADLARRRAAFTA